MKWISVDDELPPLSVGVLLSVAGGVVYGYRRAYAGPKAAPFNGVHGVIHGTVTHWMPLPLPPKDTGTEP